MGLFRRSAPVEPAKPALPKVGRVGGGARGGPKNVAPPKGKVPAVGAPRPVARAGGGGSPPDDGLVQFEVAGGAEDPGPAEGEDPSVGAGQEVAGFVVV